MLFNDIMAKPCLNFSGILQFGPEELDKRFVEMLTLPTEILFGKKNVILFGVM